MAIGRKTGGRKKGVPNKAPSKAAVVAQAAKAAVDDGLSPLDYMLRVMRDPMVDPERRDRMAAAAAPYRHSKLTAVEHSGPGGGPLQATVTVRFV